MFPMLVRTERSFLMGSALVLGALVGWSGFAYSVLSASRTVDAITGERDAALAQLRQVQETRGKLGQAQQQLAALTKRLDQARDQVSQTGSLRAEPSKAPARKP